MSHNKTIKGSSLICSIHVGEGLDLWLWRFCVQIPIKVGRLDKQIKWHKKKMQFVDFNVFEALHESTSPDIL